MTIAIGSSGNVMVALTASIMQRAAASGAAKPDGMAQGQNQSVIVSVSAQARAANAALGSAAATGLYSKSFFDKLNALQGQDKVNAYLAAARQVSADQGLPEGQFDFSHMTRGQAMVVANYLKLTGNNEADGIIDALNNAFGASDDWNGQTFDVSRLLSGASAQNPGYDAALGLIRKLQDHWSAIKAETANPGASTVGVQPDGTTVSTVTSATRTTR